MAELRAGEQFDVRVLTRNPTSEKAQALKSQGCEVVLGDLTKPQTLEPAFKGPMEHFWLQTFGILARWGMKRIRELVP